MRIVQITDTHLYADPRARLAGLDTRASLRRVLAAIRAGPPFDLLLVTGDVSMDESAGSYAWLAPHLADLDVPVLIIAGNHDDPGQWPTELAPGFVATPAAFDCGAWRVLCLNTRVPGAPHGELSPASLAWLARTLADTGSAFDLIVMHHPPIASGSRWMDAIVLHQAERFWATVPSHARLRAVVCGHVHQNIDTWHAGVRVLTTPSTCIQFARNSAHFALDCQRPGYRIIEAGEDGSLTTTVIRVELDGPNRSWTSSLAETGGGRPQSSAPRR